MEGRLRAGQGLSSTAAVTDVFAQLESLYFCIGLSLPLSVCLSLSVFLCLCFCLAVSQVSTI